MMRKIAIWYCDLSSQKQLLLNSSITAILFFFSAIVTNLIADGLGELKRGTIILLYSLAFIMIFVIIITVANVLKSHIEKIKRTAREEKETIAQAYILCDRVISASMKMIDDNLHLNGDYSGAIEGYPLKNIQEIVDATYSTFESAYGVSVNIEKRIDFEVTFMTKSYVDNKITIPASKNRDGRSPQSMVLRKNKPDIYDKTSKRCFSRSRKWMVLERAATVEPVWVSVSSSGLPSSWMATSWSPANRMSAARFRWFCMSICPPSMNQRFISKKILV